MNQLNGTLFLVQLPPWELIEPIEALSYAIDYIT